MQIIDSTKFSAIDVDGCEIVIFVNDIRAVDYSAIVFTLKNPREYIDGVKIFVEEIQDNSTIKWDAKEFAGKEASELREKLPELINAIEFINSRDNSETQNTGLTFQDTTGG